MMSLTDGSPPPTGSQSHLPRSNRKNTMTSLKFQSPTKKTYTFSMGTSSSTPSIKIKTRQDDDEVFEDPIGGGEVFSEYLSDTRISVDVMGTIFKVSRDTLYKMSFFKKIIDTEDISNIYLDRSPETFGDILKYLTYGVAPGKGDTNETTMFLEDAAFYGVSGVADVYLELAFPSRLIRDVPTREGNLVTHILTWKAASCDLESNPIFCQRLSDKIGQIPNNAWKCTGECRLTISDFVTYAIEHGSVCTNDILKTKGAQISYCACMNGREFLVINGKTTCPACIRKMRN